MSFQPQPTKTGTYLIKVYGSDKDRYWKYIPGNDRWIQLTSIDEPDKPSYIKFMWDIAPVAGTKDTFTVSPTYDTTVGLVSSSDNNEVQGHIGDSAKWKIQVTKTGGKYSKIKVDRQVLDCRNPNKRVHFYDEEENAENQRYVFKPVVRKTFEQMWFQLTPEKAATEKYDIIVIGSGMGAGVVAGDFFDRNSKLGKQAKSVLVIEKGNLPFHSHCLNAARPSGFGEDRGQQNDTFFALFKEDYHFKDPDQLKEWKGGPMYNLGGRAAAWGLFAPRIHDENLRNHFGESLADELVNDWYKPAEDMMDLSLPTTNTMHQHLMERLNIVSANWECQWQWGRIASEFGNSKNFDFATGAFSPVDKLLEIAMSKQRKPEGTCVEHQNWKILLNTEVRSIIWDDNNSRALGVVVRDANGDETKIFLKKISGDPILGPSIVLGAGSVGSPAILMRSGMTADLQGNNGLHLTDHDIFARADTFRYLDTSTREKVGSMKLQTYVRLASGRIALVNMAIDSSSFLPREFLPNQFFRNEDFQKLVVAIILPTALNKKNTIELDDNGEPLLTAGREHPFSDDDPDVKELRKLTEKVIETVKDTLKVEHLTPDPPDPFFKPLELGGVAHELGTIPLKSFRDGKDAKYLVNQDLRLCQRQNVYLSDLSVFPFSPEVNPSLTLVALALRLSKTILPVSPMITGDKDTIYVMNQTGEPIKVYISNRSGAILTREEINDNKEGKILGPGEILARSRRVESGESAHETAMVYRLTYNSDDVYLPQPVPYVALLDQICVIL